MRKKKGQKLKDFKKPIIKYNDQLPASSLIIRSEKRLSLLRRQPIQWVPFYDKKLLKHAFFSSWIKCFPFQIPLKSGELIKEWPYFIGVVEKVLRVYGSKRHSPQRFAFVGIGGGSVGDFVGFLASVFKRGVPFLFFPSTWLSAVDAAHGGKTALNVEGIKNQLGTFYPAEEIWLVKKLLFSIDRKEQVLAFSEILKMAFIEGGLLYQILLKRKNEKKKMDLKFLWSLLPLVIQLKYHWVSKDFREQKGQRQILNLGHTVGHVFEAYYQIPHGFAIFLGLQFTLKWSFKKKFLKKKNQDEMLDMVFYFSKELVHFGWPSDFLKRKKSPMKKNVFLKLLVQDKKMISLDHLNFVFLRKKGGSFLKKVSIHDVWLGVKKEMLS